MSRIPELEKFQIVVKCLNLFHLFKSHATSKLLLEPTDRDGKRKFRQHSASIPRKRSPFSIEALCLSLELVNIGLNTESKIGLVILI